jgi:hypothetical protein
VSAGRLGDHQPLLQDPRGLEIAAPSREALDSFEVALESLYGFRGDPLALIRTTTIEWPQFALAHIFRALVLLGFTEQRFAAPAAASLASAAELLDKCTPRERRLHDTATLILKGHPTAACEHLEALLLENPLDMLSLHIVHGLDFFRGDLWSLRNRINRILPYWGPDTPGYAHVLGMHAFGLEECNHYEDAEQAATASLAQFPKNPWAVHALAHVYEMQGRTAEGIQHLESRVDDWSVDSGFAPHNWWHLALLYLDRDDRSKVLTLYDEHFDDPESRYALNMMDAVALLWRLRLLDIDVGSRFVRVAEWWRDQLDTNCGTYAFNDFHAATAFAAVGDTDSMTRLEELMQHTVDDPDGIHRSMVGAIGLPLVRALGKYQRQQFADATAELVALRDSAQQLGGSHAQRDLITLTLVDAAVKSGQRRIASHYLNERLVMKTASSLGSRLREQHQL